MFEQEIFEKLLKFNKVIMQNEFSPKKNITIYGQEIDVISFTNPPLPFCVLIFETKYFPNAKLIGSANEDTKIIVDNKEILSEKRRNLFEQSDNQFKQVSKRIEKILKENNKEPSDPSLMAKMGSSMGISKEVKEDNSDSSIANMLIQGVSMGSLEIEKKLKEYDKELDKDEKSIAKKFLKFQEKTINHLKEYI